MAPISAHQSADAPTILEEGEKSHDAFLKVSSTAKWPAFSSIGNFILNAKAKQVV